MTSEAKKKRKDSFMKVRKSIPFRRILFMQSPFMVFSDNISRD